MSYHGKDGKFSSSASAYTVSKNGERFKVVRQHRRIGPAKKKNKRQAVEDIVRRSNLARQKAVLKGELSGPGWINVEGIFKD